MAADGQAVCIAKYTATMVSNIHDKQVSVVHVPGFEFPVLYLRQKIKKNNIYLPLSSLRSLFVSKRGPTEPVFAQDINIIKINEISVITYSLLPAVCVS